MPKCMQVTTVLHQINFRGADRCGNPAGGGIIAGAVNAVYRNETGKTRHVR